MDNNNKCRSNLYSNLKTVYSLLKIVFICYKKTLIKHKLELTIKMICY